ncbi:transcriptional family [Leptolyngbya sp. Heron Island J]|uniref:helix-turn-helix transcriptional regulator n=1 Tax=Leptolyngbya sp. Heron Island J TaxID=1385935 RepID=UPI0003B9F3CE|nr:AraC family transcriptional regulator [Leptolyngbya sp. Heron Island J]ESA35154.1 transcriptional family [Leptolyngbya sp. Heron Island J]
MPLTLNDSDWQDMYNQKAVPMVIDEFETLNGISTSLGQGYIRRITMVAGIELSFLDCQYHQDFQVNVSAHDHPIQICILPSGTLSCNIHPAFGNTLGYFSGSGISPGYVETYRAGQRVSCVDIAIQPEMLNSLVLNDQQRQCRQIQQLFKTDEWKMSFYPRVTAQVRSLIHQMLHVPYRGAAKQLYLQAKVFELLALHLDLLTEQPKTSASGLKPDTIDRIHYAQEILTQQLENPPSLLELAQQIGISDRTLRRGFKELYGTTVIGYLTQQRMQRAKRLLQEGQGTVTEVARIVGYGHLGHFAAAFKRQFGITPKQCLAGKHTS